MTIPPIQLHSLSDADIAIFERWLHAAHVAPWYTDPESWLREVRLRESEFRFVHHFIAWIDEQPIGFCQFYCCGDSGEAEFAAFPPATTYSIDYLIGDADYLGRGYGKAMLGELIALIIRETNAELIVVQPETENHASIALLKSLGFAYHPEHPVLCLTVGRQALGSRASGT